MHPAEVQHVREARHRALAQDEPLSIAYRVRHADGHWVWVEITARTLRHPETREPTEIHVTARDVTARVRAERALREAAERFREAFDHAPFGMGILDVAGAWQQVNRALCDILGSTRDELCATTWRALTHPEDLPRDEEAVAAILEGRASFVTREKRYLHADGRVVWVQVAVSVLRDDEGRPQSRIAQVQDVSERKRLQEQLASVAATGDRDVLSAMADRMAHQREQLSRSVLDSINARTAVVNASGGIVAVNRGWIAFSVDQGGDGRAIGTS